MELTAGNSQVLVSYSGRSEILCAQHDYQKFPGLSDDLSTYARNWRGDGWDDIKVNVPHAEGTKIEVRQPVVRPYGQATETNVIVASDTIRNETSEPFKTTVELKGKVEHTLTTEVEEEMTLDVASQIGAEIKIFTGSLTTTVGTTSRKGTSSSERSEVEFTRKVELTVPPNKAYEVKMEAVVETRQVSITLPSRIDGPFRIQYPSRRHGHYYWISQISSAAKNNHNKTNMVTIVKRGTAIDVSTVVTDAE